MTPDNIETTHLREKSNEYRELLAVALEIISSPVCNLYGKHTDSKEKLLNFLEAMDREKIGNDLTEVIRVIKGD